ncbi:MAG: nucleotide sugar dehydrogenase [bacterium]|nr:nucleotide sugar dehydrogenase [bacterium]
MGYVGVPLAHALVKAGFHTIGIDSDESRIADLEVGQPYIGHLDELTFKYLAAARAFEPTTRAEDLARADAIIVCVPTPLNEQRFPDLSQVVAAATAIARHGKPGQLVVLESTTYPGTTREVVVPVLTGHSSDGTDGAPQSPLVAYSPERINPGGAKDFTTVAKLVSGIDDESTRVAVALYEEVFAEVHAVSTVETAEAAKLLENTFRAVNIALVNELKMSLGHLGIDIWEVIDAAASKPFGFMPFYPGPGVGGHCIPVDPAYLAWKCRMGGAPLALTETAIRVNGSVPTYVVDRLATELENAGQALTDARVLVIGASYKPNISDVRESPAFGLLEDLARRGAAIGYHDPYVPSLETTEGILHSIAFESEQLDRFDAAIICTDHQTIDFSVLAESSILIMDTRHAMAARGHSGGNIVTA